MRNPILDHIQFFSDAQRAFMPFRDDAQLKSYPPFNVTRTTPNTFEIEIACAGFGVNDMAVTQDDDIITVATDGAPRKPLGTPTWPTVMVSSDNPPTAEEYPQFLHKGIAKRAFSLSFKFIEAAVIDDVFLTDGILKVCISVPKAPKPEPKKYTINTSAKEETPAVPKGKGKKTILNE